MTEIIEAGRPCSTKMNMRQFKRYGIADVHASFCLMVNKRRNIADSKGC